ncbi:hypothetical protein IFVP69_C1150059 [Vibrio parahaemolyticus]
MSSFEVRLPSWKIELSENDKYDREHTVTGYVTDVHDLTFE